MTHEEKIIKNYWMRHMQYSPPDRWWTLTISRGRSPVSDSQWSSTLPCGWSPVIESQFQIPGRQWSPTIPCGRQCRQWSPNIPQFHAGCLRFSIPDRQLTPTIRHPSPILTALCLSLIPFRLRASTRPERSLLLCFSYRRAYNKTRRRRSHDRAFSLDIRLLIFWKQ